MGQRAGGPHPRAALPTRVRGGLGAGPGGSGLGAGDVRGPPPSARSPEGSPCSPPEKFVGAARGEGSHGAGMAVILERCPKRGGFAASPPLLVVLILLVVLLHTRGKRSRASKGARQGQLSAGSPKEPVSRLCPAGRGVSAVNLTGGV